MKGKARKELEKVQSCSKKVRNEEGVSAACGHSLHEVFSCAEERLGSVCYRGHFTPNPDLKGKFQRHKCKGCKSKWRYRYEILNFISVQIWADIGLSNTFSDGN